MDNKNKSVEDVLARDIEVSQLNDRLELARLKNKVAMEEAGGRHRDRPLPPLSVRFFEGLWELVGGLLMFVGGSILFGGCAFIGFALVCDYLGILVY